MLAASCEEPLQEGGQLLQGSAKFELRLPNWASDWIPDFQACLRSGSGACVEAGPWRTQPAGDLDPTLAGSGSVVAAGENIWSIEAWPYTGR
jgi:hypothetical protein